MAASASSTLRGRPPLRPLAAAASQPGAGALDHGVAFELGEGGHDGQHGRAHRPVGVQTFGEAAESDPSGRQLVDHRENVLRVASEPVEFPDGEHVAFAEMIEAGIGTATFTTAMREAPEHHVGLSRSVDYGIGL